MDSSGVGFIFEVDHSFVAGVDVGEDINAFDLYENAIGRLQADSANKTFLLDMQSKRNVKLLAKLGESDSRLAELNALLPHLEASAKAGDAYKLELKAVEDKLGALSELYIDGSYSAGDIGVISKEVEALKVDNLTLASNNKILNEKLISISFCNDQISQENAALADRLLSADKEARSHEAITENRIKVIQGDAKAAISSLTASGQRTEKARLALVRRVEVLEADLKKAKSKLVNSKSEVTKCEAAAQRQLVVHHDVINDLAQTRTDRRYLAMMLDAVVQNEFYECAAGGVYVYSFDTKLVLKDTLDGMTTCTGYPLAMWRGNNGLCSILSVGFQSGEHVLAMPNIEGFPAGLSGVIHPPEKDQDAILAKLMEFNNDSCNAALAKTRRIISEISEFSSFIENNLLTNKNLIATSRNAGGSVIKTVRPKTTRPKSKRNK